ncbi:MAG TPA: hypothetical protein VLA33_03750 [Gemmatimonadota bacterium]|nr:hypothetical protein [Gemmatimonadota bacterium]
MNLLINVIEDALAVANHVIASEGYRSPGDYADSFRVLEEQVLDAECLVYSGSASIGKTSSAAWRTGNAAAPYNAITLNGCGGKRGAASDHYSTNHRCTRCASGAGA